MLSYYHSFDMNEVLNTLKSSANIEKILYETYTQPKFSHLDQRVFKKRRPLLNSELYLMILELKTLPSINQYTENYLVKYPVNSKLYLSEESAIRYAYCSLVRDLHFYFILKESKLFDVVEINYFFDLQAQTDILLAKGDKKLGLQLFNGGSLAKKRKQLYYEKMKGKNNYELFFFGSKSSLGKRKILTSQDGSKFTLHSLVDAQIVLQQLEKSSVITIEWDEEKDKNYDYFCFVQPVKAVERTQSISTKNCIDYKRAKHSILYIGILDSLIKKEIVNNCKKEGLIFYHHPFNQSKAIVVYDGLDFDIHKSIIENNPHDEFNMYQYMIEHEHHDKDIIVSAGAGSGKTYTLISRVIYLLNMGYINHVHEIAMITFTNEAANNMREKLAEKFITLFKETNNPLYRRYLDELREMKIMTIPAFSRYILLEYGHHLGIGQNFTISSLTMARRQAIDLHVDNTYKNDKLNDNVFEDLQYYNLMKFIEQVLEKLEQKGVSISDLQKKPFSDNPFANLVNDTLIEVDKELSKFKKENNLLTLGDLTRNLIELIKKDISMEHLSNQFSYLFIDEFQDTDNLQIEFISKLTAKAQIPLVVVGDIKQGIYRFRGANVTAFEIIQDALKKEKRKPANHSLIYNYRTSANLLNRIENVFDVWRKYNYLSSGTVDERMQPAKSSGLPTDQCYQKFKKDIEVKDVLDAFESMVRRPKEKPDENRVLALLVRKNKQVQHIGNLLKDRKKNKNLPPIQVIMEGTLFQSAAAKDLLCLLYSWLHPKDNVACYSFSQTAFCRSAAECITITENNGFLEADDYLFEIPDIWTESLEILKYAPATLVINEFINNVPYEQHLTAKGLGELEVQQYQLNLFKIIGLLNSKFENENADLTSLYNWLSNEVETNTHDDEAELTNSDFNQDYIKVMTIHKSKGLEFDTVILPYLSDVFVREVPEEDTDSEYSFMEVLIDVDANNVNYGWTFYNSTDKFYNSTPESYNKLRPLEMEQTQREETRNLYVAMTRAKEQLLIYGISEKKKPNLTNPNSWFDLIGGTY